MNKEQFVPKKLDISTIDNDFIYQMFNYYLDSFCNNPNKDIRKDIKTLVHTASSYYFTAVKNNLISFDDTAAVDDVEFSPVSVSYISDEVTKRALELERELNQFEEQLNESNSRIEVIDTEFIDKMIESNDKIISSIMTPVMTEEIGNIIEELENELSASPVSTEVIPDPPLENKLQHAFNNLKERIQSPVVNLIIIFMILRLIITIFF